MTIEQMKQDHSSLSDQEHRNIDEVMERLLLQADLVTAQEHAQAGKAVPRSILHNPTCAALDRASFKSAMPEARQEADYDAEYVINVIESARQRK